LVALQRNTVYAELEGTMTDRRVVKVVRCTGPSLQEPDDATTAFLLERYRKSHVWQLTSALIQNITMTPRVLNSTLAQTVRADPRRRLARI
jgi:hypothetical protein